MKKYLLALVTSATLLNPSISAAQNFSWEKGEMYGNASGSYSSLDLASPSNIPFGRSESAFWKDADGNIWIFGGDRTLIIGATDLKNDLLKYDLITKQWTWKKGLFYPTNSLATYGQQGTANTLNTPGARKNAASWTDKSGNLWLFGGFGHAASGVANYLNDLWKYDPLTNMWTWMKGSNQTFQLGVTGSQGIPAPANTPGCRHGSVTWVDATGDLWLYGGYGRSANGNLYELCDLWRYNIATNEWTWIRGNSASPFGKYTSLGITGNTDYPSGRRDAGSWADTSGNLWLFGGYGWTDQYDAGYKFLNDVWKYSISSGLWTWVKGSNVSDKIPVHGTKGISASYNSPGGRWGFGYANDAAGNFWVFGGRQTDGNALSDNVNDLWKYNMNTNQWTWIAGSNLLYQAGIYGTQGVPDPMNAPGARIESNGWCDQSGNIWLFGGFGHDALSHYGFLNDLWKFGNCTSAGLNILSSKDLLCEGESATLSISFAGSFNWSTGGTSSSIVISPLTNTTYSLTLTDDYGCEHHISYNANVSICEGIQEQQSLHTSVSLYPNPGKDFIDVKVIPADNHTVRIFNASGALVLSQNLSSENTRLNLNMAQGIYLYVITHKNQIIESGKLVIQ